MGINNVETVLGEENDLVLSKKVDIFFMRMVNPNNNSLIF